jgi:hypothetical protein
MGDTKVRSLPIKSVPAGTDVLYTIDSTNNTDKKITLNTLPVSNPTIEYVQSYVSGYSGANFSGYSGYSGSGVSGYSGFSGISGYSGSGISGYSGATGANGLELVTDITPQLGGDLDTNGKNILLTIPTSANGFIYSGDIMTLTVDTSAASGMPLFMAADGHLDPADATSDATAPCVAMAIEAGTGSKKVLTRGLIRNDAWNWTIGPGKTSLIYLDVTAGGLTQTQPSSEDNVIQVVGWAVSTNVIMFNPQLDYITFLPI